MTVSGSVPVEPPSPGVRRTGHGADKVVHRAEARQLRRGLTLVAEVALSMAKRAGWNRIVAI